MKKTRIYGYCRISTMKQNISRQIMNIKEQYPDAIIIEEAYTGTKIDRPKFEKLIKNVKCGDTIVFDEVSRMSRNAEEGFNLYKDLFDSGVNLVFLKEPHINTSVFREKLNKQIERIGNTGNIATDKLLQTIMEALHQYTIDIAKEQIQIAFDTAQAEVDFLHKRTSEGVRRAQAEGKQVGRKNGSTIETKKAKEAKTIILKHSKTFGGDLTDEEVQKLANISRNSLYKYKAELKQA